MSLYRRKILILGLYPHRMTRLLKAAKTLRKEHDVRVLKVHGVLANFMKNPITRYFVWWVVACAEAARFRPDIIYYFNIPELLTPGVIGAKIVSRASLAVDVRSAWIPILRDRSVPFPFILIAEWLEQALFFSADILTVPNKALRRYAMKKGVNPSVNCLVLPNYADQDIFNTRVMAQSKEVPVVAFSGSFFMKEGVDLLILAMELVPWADLWIFGEGRERTKLERFADAKLRARAIFWGYLKHDRLASYLAAADVCVIPLKPSAATDFSSPESVLKFSEYASLGRKIVATDVGMMAKGGAYLAQPNPQELANAIRNALESPRRLQAKRFDWGRREEAILRFFSLPGDRRS